MTKRAKESTFGLAFSKTISDAVFHVISFQLAAAMLTVFLAPPSSTSCRNRYHMHAIDMIDWHGAILSSLPLIMSMIASDNVTLGCSSMRVHSKRASVGDNLLRMY